MPDKKIILLSDHGVNMEVTSFPSKKKEMKAFKWNEIKTIKISNDVTGFLFFKKPTQKLEIMTTNPETPSYFNPVEFYRHENEFFDDYINELKEYAQKKNIRFDDKRK